MPEEEKAVPEEKTEQKVPATDKQAQEEDAGDFITRHVLEKDSVFFEG